MTHSINVGMCRYWCQSAAECYSQDPQTGAHAPHTPHLSNQADELLYLKGQGKLQVIKECTAD